MLRYVLTYGIRLCSNVPHTAEAYVAPPTGEDTEATDDVTELVQELRVEGADYCPRCNTQVFLAEQKVGAGNVSECSEVTQRIAAIRI